MAINSQGDSLNASSVSNMDIYLLGKQLVEKHGSFDGNRRSQNKFSVLEELQQWREI